MDTVLSFTSLIILVPLTLFIFYFGKHLHKNEYKYYWGVGVLMTFATIIAILAQLNIGMTMDDIKDIPFIYQAIFQGHMTFAFYILVMFAGAFKKKSKPKIMLMRVRRENAILGFMFLVPHATFLIVTALSALNPTGTIAFLIMIPLFITSFPKIRKKMHPLQWRKLHKWAYAAYGMVFIHLASINTLAQEDALRFVRLAIYTIIFGVYTYLKFKNYILVEDPKKKAPQKA